MCAITKVCELGGLVVWQTNCLCTSLFRNSKNVPIMIFVCVLMWKKIFISQKAKKKGTYILTNISERTMSEIYSFRYLSWRKKLKCLQKYLLSWFTAQILRFVCSYRRPLWKYILIHIYFYTQLFWIVKCLFFCNNKISLE